MNNDRHGNCPKPYHYKKEAYLCVLFVFSGLYQAHAGCLSKMIYQKLIIIGSHVTVGTPRQRGYLGAFSKMSGIECRRFLRLPHPLPLLLIFCTCSHSLRVLFWKHLLCRLTKNPRRHHQSLCVKFIRS